MPLEWIFIQLFVNTVEVGTLYYLLCSKFPSKCKTFVPTLCFIAGNIAALMLSKFVSFGNLPVAEILLPVSTLLYMLFFRSGSGLKKIFWTLISYAIMASLAFFAVTVIAINMRVSSAAAIAPNSNELLLTMILAKTSQVVIFYVLAKRKKSFESDGFLSAAPMLACLVVPFLSILMIFFINGVIHSNEKALDELVFAVSVGYLMINIIVFVLYEFISRETEKNYLLMAQNRQHELIEQHNTQVVEVYEKMREWKHDFRNHMRTVSEMLERTDSTGNNEAIGYINDLYGKIENSSLDIVTGNLVVDAIVSAKATLASANGITFTHKILLQNNALIDSTDLGSILSNALDNAIEACRKLDENRYIDFEAIVFQNHLGIKVTNSSNGEYNMENGKLKTTKTGLMHGIGMGHVKSTVESYGGIFTIWPEPKKFTAQITIPLPDRELAK